MSLFEQFDLLSMQTFMLSWYRFLYVFSVDCIRWTYTAWQSACDARQTENIRRRSVSPDGANCPHCGLCHRGGRGCNGCTQLLCPWHEALDGVSLLFYCLFIFIWTAIIVSIFILFATELDRITYSMWFYCYCCCCCDFLDWFNECEYTASVECNLMMTNHSAMWRVVWCWQSIDVGHTASFIAFGGWYCIELLQTDLFDRGRSM